MRSPRPREAGVGASADNECSVRPLIGPLCSLRQKLRTRNRFEILLTKPARGAPPECQTLLSVTIYDFHGRLYVVIITSMMLDYCFLTH